ncbi:MAG: aspartate/glutamate racemase family protein [Promethearchaeota archaeon]
MKKTKIVGILGGMGPHATIDIYNLILDSFRVKKEWEYPHVVITSNPKMPSRTRAYLFNEESPVSYLIKEARRLESAEVDFIIVPCNSAHYFLPKVRSEIKTEILDMIHLTSEFIVKKYPKVKKVAVLAGEVPIGAKLYDQKLEQHSIQVLPITVEDQKTLRLAIDMVKHQSFNETVQSRVNLLIEKLIKNGAELIILACTELPLILRDYKTSVPFIDPNKILVAETIFRLK